MNIMIIICISYEKYGNKFGFRSFQERRLLLSEIDILRTVECAGSLYVFYEDDDDYDIIHKFGKIVFNGIENHIVDSVKISEEISRGFLFMK